MRIKKKIKYLLTEEVKNSLPEFDEEKAFASLNFIKEPEKKPINPWVIRIAYSFAIILITAILSIGIYSKIMDNEYDGDSIVIETQLLFEKEMDKYGKYDEVLFMYPSSNVAIGMYYMMDNNMYKLITYCDILGDKHIINLNNDEYDVKYGVNIIDITLEEVNNLILLVGNEEVFSTIFTK